MRLTKGGTMSNRTESIGCVNLEELFGERFRVGRDEAYPASCRDPWTFVIPCERGGEIYPQGGTLIACQVDGRPVTAAKIEALPGAEVTQEGKRDKTIVVDIRHAEAVFRILKPKKRRRLSEKERTRLVKAGSEFRFKHGEGSHKSKLSRAPSENPTPKSA